MSRPKSSGTTTIGCMPPIPIVPVTHFVEEKCLFKEVWALVGPTISRNLNRITLPNQYQLYCIAFMEGMRMCYSQLQEQGHQNEQGTVRNTQIDVSDTEESVARESPSGIQGLANIDRVEYCTFPYECCL